jgi:hypothetical protein
MVYKLGNLLEDCAKIRWRRKADATPKEKLVILKNVWRAVNGWILERLETGKVRLNSGGGTMGVGWRVAGVRVCGVCGWG